jgi:hypothetical protein
VLHFYVLLCILLFTHGVQANPTCSDVFGSVGTRPAPELFSRALLVKNIDAADLRRFKGPEGSLGLLGKHPLKNEAMAHATIVDQILLLTMGVTFNELAGIKSAIDFFKDQDSRTMHSALRGDWKSIQQVYRLLTMLSGWINGANPTAPPVDLTLRQDLLRFLNLMPGDGISEQWKNLNKRYYENFKLMDPHEQRSAVKNDSDLIIVQARELFRTEEYPKLMGKLGLGVFVVRKPSVEFFELLSTWVKQLHFAEEIAQRHLANLRFILQNPTIHNSKMPQKEKLRLHMSLLRYFNKYILAQRLPTSFSEKELLTDTLAEFNRIQLVIREFDAFYKRQEILLEEALVGIETLNAQIASLEQRLQWAHQESQSVSPEMATRWQERFDRARERLARLHTEELSHQAWLDHQQIFEREYFTTENLLQEWSRQKQREDIEFFNQLDFQWDLLIAQKPYKLSGLDYDAVVFGAEVIAYFQRNLERGSFFLTALSKGYVAHKNSSGLRKINAIHPDFRDIKLLKHGGKVRLVGRLIGRTIHFFYVYDDDRAYDDGEMYRLIQRYQAP